MNKVIPIGQIILEIRGCLVVLGRDDVFQLNTEYVKEQLKRAKKLIHEYISFKPLHDSLIQRLWLKTGEDDFKELCTTVEIVESGLDLFLR